METRSPSPVLVFVLAAAAGTGLHFLYDAFPNLLTMFLAPVNERIWEHVKLLFWPYLAGMVWLCWGGRRSRAPYLASLVVISVAMLAVGYVYHVLLRGEALVFDLVLYAALMALGFLVLPKVLAPLTAAPHGKEITALLALVLLVCILVFTVAPPSGALFQDPAAAAWATLPC